MSRRACAIVSAACVLGAVVVVAAAGFFVRDPNPIIHVRWQESLGAAERTALERRFNLLRLD